MITSYGEFITPAFQGPAITSNTSTSIGAANSIIILVIVVIQIR
jgi:hypothetical protein